MRWKRLIRCAGGRRCAELGVPDHIPGVPGGTVLHIEYTCHGCGTHYAWDSASRKRTVIDSLTPGNVVGDLLQPGETKMYTISYREASEDS